MTGYLTGTNPVALRYFANPYHDPQVNVGVGRDLVLIDGVPYEPALLRFLADLAEGHGRDHLMDECYWRDCPQHECPYDHSHTRQWCGRPTCRES